MATLDNLRDALIELNEDRTLELTQELLSQDQVAAQSILSACQQALRVVGERYEREEYFISGLIMAGELFKEVLELVQPLDKQGARQESTGTIILGTGANDIHDIGKNLFGNSLRGFGFTVIDLGVDIPPEGFLEEVKSTQADVVCLSGLIAAAFDSMKNTVSLLRAHESELGHLPPVVIGGATIDGRISEYVAADSWSTDAMEGVRICQRLVAQQTS